MRNYTEENTLEEDLEMAVATLKAMDAIRKVRDYEKDKTKQCIKSFAIGMGMGVIIGLGSIVIRNTLGD